jgi:hypothetical protein
VTVTVANTFLGWLFGNGWWSAGIVLSALIAFGVAYVAASRFVKPAKEGPALFVLFLIVGPLLAAAYATILVRTASPDPGCTQECWGDLGLVALAALSLLAWEVGLVLGALSKYLRSRRRLGSQT